MVPEALEAPHPLRGGEGAELGAGGERGGEARPDEPVCLERQRGGGDAAVEEPDDEVHGVAREDGAVRLRALRPGRGHDGVHREPPAPSVDRPVRVELPLQLVADHPGVLRSNSKDDIKNIFT